MNNWKDITSYGRYKERVPTTWETRLAVRCRIVVMSDHRDYPGQWIAHVYPLAECIELEATDKEAAQAEAVGVARKLLAEISEAIDRKFGREETTT